MKALLFLVLTVGVLSLAQTKSEAAASTAESSSRPAAADFKVTDLDGNTLQLSALKGKVVLLDFWATWCPPCREEIPHFKELYAQYKGEGLEVIGLSLDQEGPAVVRSFVQQHQINYPIAIGGQKEVDAYGGIRGIPTTFLIDRQGRIAKKYVGYRGKEVFEQEIRTLLQE